MVAEPALSRVRGGLREEQDGSPEASVGLLVEGAVSLAALALSPVERDEYPAVWAWPLEELVLSPERLAAALPQVGCLAEAPWERAAAAQWAAVLLERGVGLELPARSDCRVAAAAVLWAKDERATLGQPGLPAPGAMAPSASDSAGPGWPGLCRNQPGEAWAGLAAKVFPASLPELVCRELLVVGWVCRRRLGRRWERVRAGGGWRWVARPGRGRLRDAHRELRGPVGPDG